MAYDEKLVERIRRVLVETPGLSENEMFGGMCFSVNGHMACGVQNSDLVVRVGPDHHQEALRRRHARPMDFTGRPMTGYVYVSEAGHKRKSDLERWVHEGVQFVRALPPKTPKKSKEDKPGSRK